MRPANGSAIVFQTKADAGPLSENGRSISSPVFGSIIFIRRSAGEAATLLRVGEIELDPAARCARFRGTSVDLPGREFALLQALMLAAGRVLTREQLAERLYAWGEEVESNAIDVHVHHLRRKLAPALIRTVRGVGYLLPRPQNG